MRWVYLSPHFDDVVLSCGGMIWEQVRSGQSVEIWTICAGAPQPDQPLSPFSKQLHDRWQTGPAAVTARKQEDKAAAMRLGVISNYWVLPDCIYRRLPDGTWLVNGEEDLWTAVHPQEEPVVEQLCGWLFANLLPDDHLVSPLTLGNHVDHRLVRQAAERAARRGKYALYYYSDYPYVVSNKDDQVEKVGEGWEKVCQTVSREALSAWQEAVAGYVSQISTFWGGLDEMQTALESYWRSGGGTCLWKPPQQVKYAG
jgi:LmbE family N-acetylglucosaminyl deacetylase